MEDCSSERFKNQLIAQKQLQLNHDRVENKKNKGV